MDKKLISIVVPMFNEEKNIPSLLNSLQRTLDYSDIDWELVCINDGSQDNTLAELKKIKAHDKRVKILNLSRNFGKEAALTAGLDHAKGDAVIPFDADLQDPPEVILELLQKWNDGFDVVNAVRESRTGDGVFKRFSAFMFYRTFNALSNFSIPNDVSDFRLISKEALKALHKLPERRRFMKGLFAWIGFRTASVSYKRNERVAGKTSFNLLKLFGLALEGITSFSTSLLRISTIAGVLTSLFAFIYGSKIVLSTLLYGEPVKGFPTLIASILFIGGFLMIAVGILGEYISRIYEEVKQRPLYILDQSKIDES